MSSLPAPAGEPDIQLDGQARAHDARPSMAVLIVVPTLDVGAADAGAVELVRILSAAGHRVTVVSRAGRLVADVTAAGGEFVPLDVSSNNPIVMLRNAVTLTRLARERHCNVIHALGRAGAWSAFIAARVRGIPICDQLVQRFPRAEFPEALVQQHHGARRSRDRIERADRSTDQRPLRNCLGQDRGCAVRCRSRSLQS